MVPYPAQSPLQNASGINMDDKMQQFQMILGNNDDTSIINRSYNIQVCIDWNLIKAAGRWTIGGKTEVIKDAIYS